MALAGEWPTLRFGRDWGGTAGGVVPLSPNYVVIAGKKDALEPYLGYEREPATCSIFLCLEKRYYCFTLKERIYGFFIRFPQFIQGGLVMQRSMAMALTVDSILDEIAELSLEDQELVDDIVHKRLIDSKRNDIRTDYEKALQERQAGSIKTGSVSDLFGSI